MFSDPLYLGLKFWNSQIEILEISYFLPSPDLKLVGPSWAEKEKIMSCFKTSSILSLRAVTIKHKMLRSWLYEKLHMNSSYFAEIKNVPAVFFVGLDGVF